MENSITIKKLLMKAGISPELGGYHYLTEAINTVKDALISGDVECKITIMYADIAKKFNTTSIRVERNIRHAVEKAFVSPSALVKEIFSGLIDTYTGKVTNSCFIYTLAEHLIIEESTQELYADLKLEQSETM